LGIGVRRASFDAPDKYEDARPYDSTNECLKLKVFLYGLCVYSASLR
jgi:hypothetical protein